MLQNLHVKNLALIDECEVEFSDGLNILSGETLSLIHIQMCIRDRSLIVKKNYHSLMDHLGSVQEFDLARKKGGINIVPPYAQKQIKVYEGRVEAIESLKGYLRKCTQKYVCLLYTSRCV